jgi:predicted transcriptional regulator
MSILKAPPKLIRNATIQVRVEEEVDSKLRKYAEFIDATPAFVVAESLKLLFNKDAEFREWLTSHTEATIPVRTEKSMSQEVPHSKSGTRSMFEEELPKTAAK